MIVVRNVFRLRFGKAREALALWKEGAAMLARAGMGSTRLLTDIVGPFYTLVVETTHDSFADWESASQVEMSGDDWKTWYARFTPMVESGYREVLTLHDATV